MGNSYNKIPPLDEHFTHKSDGYVSSSVYQKSINTGQGMHFLSRLLMREIPYLVETPISLFCLDIFITDVHISNDDSQILKRKL